MINFLDKYPFVLTIFYVIIWVGCTIETLTTGFKTFKRIGRKVECRLTQGRPAVVYLFTDRGGRIKLSSGQKFTVAYNGWRFESSEYTKFTHTKEFAIKYAGRFELLEGGLVLAEITANNGEVELLIPRTKGQKVTAIIVEVIITSLLGIGLYFWYTL